MNRFKHLALLVGLAMGSALAAGTAPGTNIINTASATYTDPDAATQTTSSNTVTTTVQPKGGFSITLDQTSQTAPSIGNDTSIDSTLKLTGSAGQKVIYTYTVANDGNYDDTYNLTTTLAAGATVAGLSASDYSFTSDVAGTTPITSVTVAAGVSKTFYMVVTVPVGAINGQVAYADPVGTATVTSVPKVGGGTFTVPLAGESNNNFQYNKLTVNPSALVAATKTVTKYYTSYTSSSVNTPQTLASGYKPKIGDYIEYSIAAINSSTTNAAGNVVVTDVLPSGTTYTAASFTTGTGTVVNASNTLTITPTSGLIAKSSGIAITVVAQITALKDISATPDGINDPVVNSATVAYKDPSLPATSTNASSDPTNVAGVGVGPLAFATGTASGTITTTESAPNAPGLTVTRSGTGIANDGSGAPGDDTSTIASAVVNANGTTTDIVFPGTVRNIGTATDTFILSSTFTSNNIGGTPTVAYYSDAAATIPITGPISLMPGAFANYYVKVTLPAATPTYTGTALNPAVGLTVTATSTNNAGVSDVTKDALTSTDRRSTLVGNNDNTKAQVIDNNGAPDLTKLVKNVTPNGSAQTVSYPVDLVNTGATSDTVTLSGTVLIPTVTTPGGVSTTVQYYTTTDGVTPGTLITSTTVPAGTEQTILAVVTVPANAVPTTGTTGLALNQTFTSTQNGTVNFNPDTTDTGTFTKGDLLTIGTNNSFTFTADNFSRITAVGSVIYAHTLTNTSANTTITGGSFGVALDTNRTSTANFTGSGLSDTGSSLDSGTQTDFVLTYSSTIGGTYTSSLPAISTLAPGASQTVYVKVVNTKDNNVSAVNDVVFQAAPIFNLGTNPAAQYVEDVTLVRVNGLAGTPTDPSTPADYALKPLKSVKTCADADCTVVNDASGLTAKPGNYLQYTIVTKNNRLSAADLKNVFVLDIVPSNTTFTRLSATSDQTGTILYSTDGGLSWLATAPTSVATTVFRIGLNTNGDAVIDGSDVLNTGKTITVIFTVKVN
ncbi:DUF11 domain-containing protein [Deinococcus detaillensis]|uniref:DUF11 domain-containing protein n=1 Tax=Deinococcus detaillensis TaxID=2592048 RepID=A0A553UU70_9DEIO|nr:DUF11 domain-containing protein [Deinococcus detaillensis]TSA83743.1 DUF11 domain-containing protein [Deinococcus detaillensis]